MKARTRATWRLARLTKRLWPEAAESRLWKRNVRGGGQGRCYWVPEERLWRMNHSLAHVGKNHRQGRITDDLKPTEAIILAPPTEQRRQPRQRPAARPSWAIAAGLRRFGLGYRKRGTA